MDEYLHTAKDFSADRLSEEDRDIISAVVESL